MKLNITVDLEWLEENGNIEEETKQQIITGIKNAISRDCLAKVEKKASAEIDKAINESISSATTQIHKKAVNFFEDWLEKDIVTTDQWGNEKQRDSIGKIIEKSFEDMFKNGKVDECGNLSDRYGSQRIIDYVTGKKIKNVVNEKIGNLSKEIDQKIEDLINAGIRSRVSDKFAEMVIQTAKHQNKNQTIEMEGE